MIVNRIIIGFAKQEGDVDGTPDTKFIEWNKADYLWYAEKGMWPADLKLITTITEAIKHYNGGRDKK